MASKVEYNSILSEREFDPETDKFRCGKKAQTVIDVSGKTIGSVSNDALFDLFGNAIATLKTEETRDGGDGKDIRVAEYMSDIAHYRLVGDELFTVTDGDEKLFARVSRKQRNIFRIVVLSALSAILIAMIVLLALINLPFGETEQPIIDVSDTNGTWQEQGVIAMFGDKVLPGSDGEYGFVLNNPHNADMQYSFYIEPKYDGNATPKFPLVFRLRMNNVLIATEEWLTVDELRYDDLVLMSSSTHSFVLEWSWPFDGGDDGNDTLIGEDGGKVALVLHLTAQAA